MLPGLGLTRLELDWRTLLHGTSQLHHISCLTALQDLQCYVVLRAGDNVVNLWNAPRATFTASMLAPLSHLTSLQLNCEGVRVWVGLEPGALAGKTKMQHLQLRCARVAVDGELPADSVPVVLSALQEMRQLTHLELQSVLRHTPISAAAYTALAPSCGSCECWTLPGPTSSLPMRIQTCC